MVIMTHQILSLEKYWKLLPATLNVPGQKLAQKRVDNIPAPYSKRLKDFNEYINRNGLLIKAN